ncbi:hypothetical protein [Streptomyces sp. KL116D]|uniref:hypothetical protein n=1 Tax=Streptomyces sp. KL116D TaxID=3045152 RepID=UPI0035588119
MRHGRIAALVAAGALLVACGGREPQADEAASARPAHGAAEGRGGRLGARRGDDGQRQPPHVAARARSAGPAVPAAPSKYASPAANWPPPTRKLGGDPSQTRFLPDAYYTRMTDAFAAFQGGRHWIRHPYDAHSDLTPADSLKALAKADDVRRVGRETVHGVRPPTTGGPRASSASTSGSTPATSWCGAPSARAISPARVRYSDYGAKARAERPSAHDTVDFDDVTEAR